MTELTPTATLDSPPAGLTLKATFETNVGEIADIAWSPAGDCIAVAGTEGCATFDLTGKEVSRLTPKWCASVAWCSADSSLVAAGASLGVVSWAAGKATTLIAPYTARPIALDWSPNGTALVCGMVDNTVVRLLRHGSTFSRADVTLPGRNAVNIAWSPDSTCFAVASADGTAFWLVDGETLSRRVAFRVESSKTHATTWTPDGAQLISASADGIGVWDPHSGRRIALVEGHTQAVYSLASSPDGRLLVSKSLDGTVRFWDPNTWATGPILQEVSGRNYQSGGLAFHPHEPILGTLGDGGTAVRIWNYGVDELFARRSTGYQNSRSARVTETTAKIVFVGESNVGKSCLAMRLAEHRYPRDDEQGTTHGMRFWRVPPERIHPSMEAPSGERRDLVLWDLGGQDEYRLVHQLFLHDTTVALVLFDPSRGRTAFGEVEEWNKRLDKQLRGRPATKLLIGAKLDQPTAATDNAAIAALVQRCGFQAYIETSARTGRGVESLRNAIAQALNWSELGYTNRPLLFQRVRDIVTRHREAGDVVLLLSELSREVERAEPDEFEPAAVDAVTRQLALQGVVATTTLASGEHAAVLRVEEVERYAGALVLSARSNRHGVPAVEERVLGTPAQGVPGIEVRLPRIQERIVLECVAQLFVASGICLRHEGLLVFPTLFSQTEAPDELLSEAVSLFYDFSGAIDNVYASLVARLVAGGAFGTPRLWHDRAELDAGHRGAFGLRKINRGSGFAHLDVYFVGNPPHDERELFVRFVEEHLRHHDIDVVEHLELVCPRCRWTVPDEVLHLRISSGAQDVGCGPCDTRIPLSGAMPLNRGPDPAPDRTLALRTRTEAALQLSAKAVKAAAFGRDDAVPEGPLRLLHLSDLHIHAGSDCAALLEPLVADLLRLNAGRLDYLVVSGDLTNTAAESEFEAARQFLSALMERFDLSAQRCLLVPGNHDQTWEIGYTFAYRLGKVAPGHSVEAGRFWLVRDSDSYPDRFANFDRALYHKLLQRPYPRAFEEQGRVHTYPDDGLQIVALNSEWEVDQHFEGRAGVHPGAVARALAAVRAEAPQEPTLKIAVLHRPITGRDAPQDTGFVEQLRDGGFRLVLHGHVHEEVAELPDYQRGTLHAVGAGTFGSTDRPPSTPRLYNLLEIQRDLTRVRVHTRARRKDQGSWDGWTVWPGKTPTTKRSFYDIVLERKAKPTR